MNAFRIVILSLAGLTSFSALLYFVVSSRKDSYVKYYRRGFSFVSFGFTLMLFDLMIGHIPKPFGLIRKLITLMSAFYGLYLVLLGDKKKKTAQRKSEDEKSEELSPEIRRNDTDRPE